MLPVGFEPTISAGERPQTHALDLAATGIGICRPLEGAYRGLLIVLLGNSEWIKYEKFRQSKE